METVSPRSACEQEFLASHIGKIVAYPPAKLRGLILDMDGTLYRNEDYLAHTRAVDLNIIADHLGLPSGEAQWMIDQARQSYGAILGVPKARLTQTLVDHFSMRMEDWNRGRTEGYQPHQFLHPDPSLSDLLRTLLERVEHIAIASNSPRGALQNVLQSLGIHDDVLQRLNIHAPDTLGLHKPDPQFFACVADAMGLPPGTILSIGNEEDNDAEPAIAIGMGAGIVAGPNEISAICDSLLDTTYLAPVDLPALARTLQRPGMNRIIGIIGRAGAGKSTFAHALADATHPGIHGAVHLIGLDTFFKLSSPERAAWLNEGGLSVEERWQREDQTTWWDFAFARDVLRHLRYGEPIHINGLYNQEDSGRKTGMLSIDPHPSTNLIIMEGVGVPFLADELDEVIFVNAHECARRTRVYERDIRKRGLAEAARRWDLTQRFEHNLFAHSCHHMTEKPFTVIDNSEPSEGQTPPWRSLPKRIPSR